MAIPISYNLRSLLVRWRTNLMAIFAMALVVAVLIGLMALRDGFRLALRATGSSDNAIMLQRGSNSELTSGISREAAALLMADDRIARDRTGQALVSPEIVVVANFIRRSDRGSTNVLVRGVTPGAFDVRRGITIERGRKVQPGLQEVIVGQRASASYAGLELGGEIRMQRRSWKVVGVFSADGSGFENEVWGDLNVMAPAFNRSGGYQSITAKLRDVRDVPFWQRQLESDPQLRVDIKVERDYYEAQAGGLGAAILGIAVFVSIVMGIGAVIAAMNTMYATVAARGREVATLRALGFSKRSILLSFLLESVLLSAVGGLAGCLISQLANLGSYRSSGVNFSEVSFAMRVTPSAMITGLILSLALGFLGGILPSLRAASTPISSALRES